MLGRPVRDWAADLLAIAGRGLERLNAVDGSGQNEARYLRPLHEIVDSGQTLADRLLDLWATQWGRRIEPIFESSPVTF